jgi:hypothetical protein
MPNQLTRCDALREYLTGAGADGGVQADPNLSLGGYRSATEAVSLGIFIANAITNALVLFAGGANPTGDGTLTTHGTDGISWRPSGAVTDGDSVIFAGVNDVKILEALGHPEQYLRVQGSPPFSGGPAMISLSRLVNNFYGFPDVSQSQSTAGISQYRATVIRNESGQGVSNLRRWLSLLGTARTASAGLPGAGAGTITTAGSFADWPTNGWCQVRSSVGTLKEVVYYESRSNTVLNVTASSRALLGTSGSAGAAGDVLYPIPGVAVGIESAGIQNFGNPIQIIANETTAPTAITWNLGISQTTGLNIGALGANKQVGIWVWRHIPPGAKSTPQALYSFEDSFDTY